MGKGNWEILFNVTLLNCWLGVRATFKVSSQHTNDQERYFGAAEAVFNKMLSRSNPYLAVGRGFLTPPPRFFHISYRYRFLNLIYLKKEEIKKIIWNLFASKGRILSSNLLLKIQGYPQRMRLQRRLYEIYSVRFLVFMVPDRFVKLSFILC